MLASPAPLEGGEGESLFLEFHPGGMHGTGEAVRGTCQPEAGWENRQGVSGSWASGPELRLQGHACGLDSLQTR